MPKKRACDACYRRKIECVVTVQDTPCDWCRHHNLECTFVRERPRRKQRKRAQSSDVQELARRVAQLEDGVPQPIDLGAASSTASTSLVVTPHARTATTPRSSVTDENIPNTCKSRVPVTRPRDVESSTTSLHSAARHLGPHWFFNGVPIFSDQGQNWISSRTGQQIQWSDFRFPVYKPTSLVSSHLHDGHSSLLDLIDRDTAQRTIGALFGTNAAVAFTVIDPILFDRTIETAYEKVDDALSSFKHVAARACLLAAVSVASLVGSPGTSFSSCDMERYAIKARHLVTLNPGYMSLDTLVTVLLLQIKCTLNGNWQDADFFHTIACRTVCALGYHAHHPSHDDTIAPSLEERSNRHGRKLFWLCYTSDQDISLHTGVPPMLIDEFCDLEYTRDGPNSSIGIPSLATTSDIEIAFFPGDIHLAQIKTQVCRLLYSPKAFKDFDSQVLHNIRHLDDRIEQWRLSIPPIQRPALISSSFSNSLGSGPRAIHHISLQLQYLYLMVVVHMAVRRFKPSSADISDIAEDRHRLIHSSVDISLEASRSIFECLKVMINSLAGKAISPVVRYAAPSAVTLVVEMLVHPRNEQGPNDLELLIAASNSIRSMATTALGPSEIAYIKNTSSFIMDLVFLGTCALRKAGRDEEDHGTTD